MTPDNARRVANGLLIAAGVAVGVAIVSQPKLRRMMLALAPIALRKVRPVHVVAAIAALVPPAAASTSTSSRTRERVRV